MTFPALDQARQCVAFLFAGEGDDAEPVGTCFFVADSRSMPRATYLVTAKHVLEALQLVGSGYVRLNSLSGDTTRVAIDVGLDWQVHDDPNVDLAARRWLDEHDQDDLVPLDVGPALDGEDLGASSWLREAEDVAFLGLMRPFVSARTNLLPLRTGTIALVTDQLIVGHYGPSRYTLIQAQTYPANSGSPVWIVVGRAFFFTGVLVFGFPSPDDLRRVEGDKYTFYNLGMSLVAPREQLLEILVKLGARRADLVEPP